MLLVFFFGFFGILESFRYVWWEYCFMLFILFVRILIWLCRLDIFDMKCLLMYVLIEGFLRMILIIFLVFFLFLVSWLRRELSWERLWLVLLIEVIFEEDVFDLFFLWNFLLLGCLDVLLDGIEEFGFCFFLVFEFWFLDLFVEEFLLVLGLLEF